MAQKLVRIQSTVNITVTAGLQHEDITREDSDIPNRLKVNIEWPKYSILIKQGVDTYPAEIAEWPTVQALAKDNILTIGDITEDTQGKVTEEEKHNLEELKAKKTKKTKKLDEIAEK